MLIRCSRHTKLLTVAPLRFLSSSRHCLVQNAEESSRKIQSLDDYLKTRMDAPVSRLPQSVDNIVTRLRNKFAPLPIDPELKVLLDRAATQLYYDCANHYDYSQLCNSFGLPDYFSSWFKLTLMHIWMVLLRLHVSLDAAAFIRLQTGLLTTLWMDVDKRLEIVSAEIGKSMTTSSDISTMHGLHLQTFLEYDEGFLSTDAKLAAAIWRNLYLSRDVDPTHVHKVIIYMRSTCSWLDSLSLDDLLVEGVKHWKQHSP